MLPDLIVTDLSMPKMDGHEFISRLKSRSHTEKIPIIVLAGRSTGSDPTPVEDRAEHIVYKDVDIDTQLRKALTAALGES